MTVVPIFVGAHRTNPKNLAKIFKELEILGRSETTHMTTQLGKKEFWSI